MASTFQSYIEIVKVILGANQSLPSLSCLCITRIDENIASFSWPTHHQALTLRRYDRSRFNYSPAVIDSGPIVYKIGQERDVSLQWTTGRSTHQTHRLIVKSQLPNHSRKLRAINYGRPRPKSHRLYAFNSSPVDGSLPGYGMVSNFENNLLFDDSFETPRTFLV